MGGLNPYTDDDSEEYIKFVWERSILPYWREVNDLPPESHQWLIHMSQGTFASLAFKIGVEKTLSVGNSADLMNAIIALRDGIPRPESLGFPDLPKFPIVEEELRGRTHIRIPRI